VSEGDLLRRVCATYRTQREMAGERVEHPLATIVRAPPRPDVWDANFAIGVSAKTPEEIQTLVEALDAAMPQAVHVRKFHCDPFTPPPFVARLAVLGFAREGTVQLVLEGELLARPRELEIRRAQTDDDWAAVASLTADNMREELLKQGHAPPEADFLRQFVGLRRELSSEMHMWLARDRGEDCGFFASWPGVEQMGMVEWLFTCEEHRRRGVATALVAHAVADARARGAREVLIGASAGADAVPRQLYASLGFRPVCVTEEYLRFV
jgi:GNAT superfamily N-acetyltransferase